MLSRSASPAWKSTWLWKTLAKRSKNKGNAHASEFLPTLELWMRLLDTVLAKGGTSPSDFTLHDADHALRVADRIEQLLTDSIRQNLSDYELALLLLAAYSHDIGMTPERGKVTAHHRHLFDPDGSALTEKEKASFQSYLDEHDGHAISLPLTAPIDLNLADELVAFYVRERHNDWSAEWIRENLIAASFAFLPDVVEILVRLCTSHHLDVLRLDASDFDPLLSNGPVPQLIHLRYLACLLRLADILENDPERTPAVLLRHRALEDRPRSLVHWQKDHALTIDIRGDNLHFQARPRTAVAHRALIDLKDWIDHELHGIVSFGERLPAEKTVGKQIIRRDWHLAPAVTHDIRPFNEAYEYIDGAFRPNTARLLQLLSGEQLYGNPLHAVRELLQNAFDAVREKIARKRLTLPNPANRRWEEELGNQEHVILTLRPGPAGGWELVCEDSGVGLTRDIINRHVLVSGTGRRHAIRQLERDCQDAGFHPGLTGQFGIGVLSYFMLAEAVTLETTRYQGCNDGTESWRFTTRGVGSFGELKKLPTSFLHGGSRVTWELKRQWVTDSSAFAQKLLAYLVDTLVRLPCRFEYRIEGVPKGNHIWKRDFGWVTTEEDWIGLAQSKWKSADEIYGSERTFISEAERRLIEELKAQHPTFEADAQDRLRCEFLEVPLPDNAGIARVVVTYFELKDGRSLMHNPTYPGHEPFRLESHSFGAWRGMGCAIRARNAHKKGEIFTTPLAMAQQGISVEVDLLGEIDSALGVDREGVIISSHSTDSWRNAILTAATALLERTLATGSGNLFHEINQATRNLPLTLAKGVGWFHIAEEPRFRPLQFPAAISFAHKAIAPNLQTSEGEPVTLLGCDEKQLRLLPRTFELKFIQSKRKSRRGYPSPLIFWKQPSATPRKAIFPKEWERVAIFVLAYNTFSNWQLKILNEQHPLLSLLSKEQRETVLLPNTHGHRFWEELASVESPGNSAWALLRAALSLSTSFYSKGPSSWNKFVNDNEVLMESHWNLISQDLGRETSDLEFQICTQSRTLTISPRKSAIGTTNGEAANISSFLPAINDPSFLLYETDTLGRE